jgi:hypothetical protein
MTEIDEREIPPAAAKDIRECVALQAQAADRTQRVTNAVAKGMGYDLDAETAEGFRVDLVEKKDKLFFRRVDANAVTPPGPVIEPAKPNRADRRRRRVGQKAQ